MTLPASLAFYLDHAAQVDELVTMEKPSDVSPEDWRMFQDVYGWACGHVEAILDKARASAREALSSRAKTTAGNKQAGVREDWFAWTQLNPTSPVVLEGILYAGVSLGATPSGGALVLAPYLAVSKTAQREGLVARLIGAGFAECVAATDSDDTVNLRPIPIGKDTDLDAAIAESTECFRLLAERWEKVFGSRA